jgi:hypothetical protein
VRELIFFFFSLLTFISIGQTQKLQFGIESGVQFTRINEFWGTNLGADLSPIVRYSVFQNKVNESVFIEGSAGMSYLKGWVDIKSTPNGEEYGDLENNYRVNFSLKVGTHFGFRNSMISFRGGLEKYYLPSAVNKDLYRFMFMKGEVFEVDLGFCFREFKILDEISLKLNTDISPLNFKSHGYKNKLIGLSLIKFM